MQPVKPSTSPLPQSKPVSRSQSDPVARYRGYNSRYGWQAYLASLVLTDLLMTFAAFKLAYWLRFHSGLPIFMEGGMMDAPFYDNIMIAIIPIWLVIFAVMGLYNRENLLGGVWEYSAIINAVTLGMLLIVIARFSLPDDLILARGWALSAWLLTIILIGFSRFLLRRVVYGLRAKGYLRSNTLLVGFNQESELMSEQFHENPLSSMHLAGFIAQDPNTQQPHPFLTQLGTISDLDEVISRHHIERLVITKSAISQDTLLDIYQRYGNSANLEILLSSGVYEMITTGMQVQVDGSVPLVKIHKMRMTGADRFLKALMDYSIALVLIILLSPLLLLIALIVKIDSPGPVIYRRRVMGSNAKQFDAFKFRSMDPRSEEILRANPELLQEYKENFKIKDDPRITRSGRILRKLSLDELPQLFNVLRGEMSLVGPRMITPEELDKYAQWAYNLLTVKPGLTGFWQVHGRSDVSYEERVRMDMYYIRNWTIWLDVQLLIGTIPAVLARRGAY